MNIFTLMNKIEEQIEREIALELQQMQWERKELKEPLVELLLEHHRVFNPGLRNTRLPPSRPSGR